MRKIFYRSLTVLILLLVVIEFSFCAYRLDLTGESESNLATAKAIVVAMERIILFGKLEAKEIQTIDAVSFNENKYFAMLYLKNIANTPPTKNNTIDIKCKENFLTICLPVCRISTKDLRGGKFYRFINSFTPKSFLSRYIDIYFETTIYISEKHYNCPIIREALDLAVKNPCKYLPDQGSVDRFKEKTNIGEDAFNSISSSARIIKRTALSIGCYRKNSSSPKIRVRVISEEEILKKPITPITPITPLP